MHAELRALVAADQADCEVPLPVDLGDRDRRRLQRLRQILLEATAETLDGADLFAAAIDRLLIRRGEPQRFGTQRLQVGDEPEALRPVEPSTTDEDRSAWDVPALAALLAEVDGRVVDRATILGFR